MSQVKAQPQECDATVSWQVDSGLGALKDFYVTLGGSQFLDSL